MTRTRAREAAVRLIYAQAASGLEPDALVDEYFELSTWPPSRTRRGP